MKNMTKAISYVKHGFENLRSATLDRITSIASNGRSANTETYNNSELRELRIVLPYGISSSALDGMVVQVIVNEENENDTIVGVIDGNRPSVKSGEVIIYSRFGSQIELLQDGNINIISDKHVSVISDKHVSVNCKTASISAPDGMSISSIDGDINISTANGNVNVSGKDSSASY